MSFFKKFKDDGKAEAFEKQQRLLADKVRPLLNSEANPGRSDADLDWLRNETSIEESVGLAGGAREDADYVLRTLSGAARHYQSLYGEQPSEGQLAAMGGALESFRAWKDLSANNKLSHKIIAEAAGDSDGGAFSIIPHFMSIAALVPLTAVSYNFCHSIGAKKADKVTVCELEELAGDNPYGVPEGSKLNGYYEGGLSNTRRRVDPTVDVTDTDDASDPKTVTVDYNCQLEYPISKSRVFLIVNKRTVAMDNGAGVFNIIGDGQYDDGLSMSISSSTIEYSDASNSESEITATLVLDVETVPTDDPATADTDERAAEIQDNIPVWFRVETDVENYPEFISETKYATRSFDLYSEPYILSTGMTLQAVLKSIRNMRRNVPDIAFSRLLAIVAADMDRKTLGDLRAYSEGNEVFDMSLNDYRDAYEQWARIREPMHKISEDMRQDTGGATGVKAFIGGGRFKLLFMNMGDKWVKIADTARNPALANQPHYIGKFEGYQLFFDPSIPFDDSTSEEIAIGVGRGPYISQCGTVVGVSVPPLLRQHATQADLARRCSVYGESFSDQPPEAYKYVKKLTLTNIP